VRAWPSGSVIRSGFSGVPGSDGTGPDGTARTAPARTAPARGSGGTGSGAGRTGPDSDGSFIYEGTHWRILVVKVSASQSVSHLDLSARHAVLRSRCRGGTDQGAGDAAAISSTSEHEAFRDMVSSFIARQDHPYHDQWVSATARLAGRVARGRPGRPARDRH